MENINLAYKKKMNREAAKITLEKGKYSSDQAGGAVPGVVERKGIIRGTRSPKSSARYFKPIAQTIIYLPPLTWVLLDVLFGLASFFLAHWISPYNPTFKLSYDPLVIGLILGTVMAVVRHVLDTHNFIQLNSLVRIFVSSLASSLVAISLVTLALSLAFYIQLGRTVLIYTFFTSTALMTLTRVITRGWVARARHRVVFLGTRTNFQKLKRQLEDKFRNFFQSPLFIQVGENFSVAEFRSELLSTLELFHPNEIVIEDHSPAESWVMEYCLEISKAGCLIRLLSRFNEELNQEEDLDVLTPRQLLMTPGLGSGAYTGMISKRAADMVLSLAGLLFSFPVGLIVAVCMKLTSPGPIFYRQKRVGQYGKNFNIIKFRTMRMDAEKNGAVWAAQNDGRCTPLGRILRKTRLDEIPQFWNILRGDMSFVGPRPERPEFVEQLEKELPNYHFRHLVKPGLTGWAQIQYRYGASREDSKRKLAYDLYYVSHYGWILDISIFLKTLVAMAKGSR